MLDKTSDWGYNNGLKTMIPTALLMSMLGYSFVLPDMVGGNGYPENMDEDHDSFAHSTFLPPKVALRGLSELQCDDELSSCSCFRSCSFAGLR